MKNEQTAIAGIGGAGGNFLNYCYQIDNKTRRLFAIDTDTETLEKSRAGEKICIQQDAGVNAANSVKGNSEECARLTVASLQKIMSAFAPCRRVVLIAGLGGGAGSGVLPILADACRAHGKDIACIGIMPFHFEGKERMERAGDALQRLKESGHFVETLNNQDLFGMADERTTFFEAFNMADRIMLDMIDGFDNSENEQAA